MLGWVILIAAVIAMYRITDMEGKNGILWGILTFVICLGCALLIPLPLLNVFMGFALSFAAYFTYKIVKNE